MATKKQLDALKKGLKSPLILETYSISRIVNFTKEMLPLSTQQIYN